AVEIVGRARDAERQQGQRGAGDSAMADVAEELSALSAALHEVDDHDHPHRMGRDEAPAQAEQEPRRGTTATG
ncbi:MAG: hypothetical protein KY454_11190, partial [Actinobacteria bacterium]|nr:hypothetical protein [Actinomycetota bacterium]